MTPLNNLDKLQEECKRKFKHFLDITAYYNITDKKWNVDVLCIGKAYYGEDATLDKAIKNFREKNFKCK